MAGRQVQRHGAALREAGEHDAGAVDAARVFPVDEPADGIDRFSDAAGVLDGAAVDAGDVVPGAHLVTVVDGHRAHWRMRKDEAQRRHARLEQLRHQRLEIVAIGAEAVHPDDREFGGRSGFYGDGLERLQTQLLQTIVSEIVVTVRFAAHMSWSTSSRTPGKKVYAAQNSSAVNPIHMRPCSRFQPGWWPAAFCPP